MRTVMLSVILTLLPGCGGSTQEADGNASDTIQPADSLAALIVTSNAFADGALIPQKYTCDSTDISPALHWSGAPERTKSFALICDDPDAPGRTWVHWVIYNIPPDSSGLDAHVPPDTLLSNGALQGLSDFRHVGYGGPCPPKGTHRYVFKLYALDLMLDIGAWATKDELLAAMDGHVIARGQLVGRYTRTK